jgi:hypothetical protein
MMASSDESNELSMNRPEGARQIHRLVYLTLKSSMATLKVELENLTNV